MLSFASGFVLQREALEAPVVEGPQQCVPSRVPWVDSTLWFSRHLGMDLWVGCFPLRGCHELAHVSFCGHALSFLLDKYLGVGFLHKCYV